MIGTTNLSEQNKILSSIDALKAVLEKFPDGECEAQVSLKPIPYLLELLKHCGVTEEALIQWLVKYIKYVVPVIELAVKGILLSNLKNMVSCSVDPMIPAYARDGEHEYNSGMTFDLNQIDSLNMLQSSPLNNLENQLYFGIDRDNTNKTPYDFLRPIDFNTFLWYIITRGRYPMPTEIKGNDDYKGQFTKFFNAVSVDGDSIFQFTDLKYSDGGINTGIVVGNSFKETIKNRPLNVLGVCNLAERNDDGQIIRNTIIPVSNSWDRTNYYVNRPTYFNFIDPNGTLDETNPRDYNKDIALCSFKYCNEISEEEKKTSNNNYNRNKINIKILPKPLVHIPHIGQSCLLPKKILFDYEGNPNINGRFSVISVDNECEVYCGGVRVPDVVIDKLKDALKLKDPSEKISGYTKEEYYWVYKLISIDKTESKFFLLVDKKGNYSISTTTQPEVLSDELKKDFLLYLRECYCNLTIFEFNYDYIMSMRLYNAEVIVTQLINQILSFQVGFQVGLRTVNFEGEDRIVRLIKKIIDADDYESSDCFYTFSNDEYDEMSRNAELKRANLGSFGDCGVDNSAYNAEISDLLNKFGDASTLQESIDTFTHVIESVSAVIENEGSDETSGLKLEVHGNRFSDIISQIIENLALTLVNSLLSPKVILMIMINLEMCGQTTKNFSFEQIIQKIIGIISQIVKEMLNLLIQELFDFVMSQIIEILKLLVDKLMLEQIENFRKLIKQLLEECWFSFGRQAQLPTELDVVNYADIDENQQQTNNGKC